MGLVAAAFGSGVGWAVVGVVVAIAVGARRTDLGWVARTAAVAVFYLTACLTYYASDWVLSLPGTMRLQDDIDAGRIPDPGGSGLAVPDLGEWLFWSLASLPAALLATVVAALILRAGSLVSRVTNSKPPHTSES